MVKVTKAQSMSEPILIMLVSKETIAVEAWVSRSPTCYTQELFLKIKLLGINVKKEGVRRECSQGKCTYTSPPSEA